MRQALVFILLAGAATAFSQDLPSYAAASARPKTVVDYFLLCPAITVDEQGYFRLAPPDGRVDQKQFEAKKSLLRQGEPAPNFKITSVRIDVPHAYIQIGGGGSTYTFELTFVFFDRAGRTDIPAFSYTEKGLDGTSYAGAFFEIGKSGWKDVTTSIVPSISLDDFDKGSRHPEVQWEFVLPRQGTTVVVSPRMTSEMGRSAGGDDYEFVDRMSKRGLQLLWDRVKGVFTKGAMGQG